MKKIFNVTATCRPSEHYMVNIESRLEKIKKMVDAGQYFTINRARQYGKTTTLHALVPVLKSDYIVISMDFQKISSSKFQNENTFSITFAKEFIKSMELQNSIVSNSIDLLKEALADNPDKIELYELFGYLENICRNSEKPIVLMIDEVDSATNNEVFMDFLAQLRQNYIDRNETPTFQSVILAGVYDIKNIKRKISQEYDQRVNSPWNIAADFLIDMSFSTEDIAGMLEEYEKDYHTGMNLVEMARLLYDYTSGYPFLVSRLCKLMDERIVGTKEFPDKSSTWKRDGFLEAVKLLLNERNTLFESLINKLADYPELRQMLYELLFMGKMISYNPFHPSIEMAEMFGFIKNENGNVVIANRIFETLLYNHFLSEEMITSKEYDIGFREKNQFVVNGHLDMRKILERFVVHFDDLYGDQDEIFLEDAGRRYFMLFLKPIINGIGNCYVEAQTRNRERMDLVVDYHGEQFIIELKIWRGNAYHIRGEKQLSNYLDYYHLKKGYMLSFCFNREKEIGVREIVLGDKVLIEAVV